MSFKSFKSFLAFLFLSWKGRGLLVSFLVLVGIVSYNVYKLFKEDEEEPKKNSWIGLVLLVVSIILNVAIVVILYYYWVAIDKGKKLIDSGLDNNEPGVFNEVIQQLIGVITGKNTIKFKGVIKEG